MSAEKDTLRRVQDGLFHLSKGASPFVETRMKSVHGDRWLHYASRAAGGHPNEPLDVYGLLKTILDNWRSEFCRRSVNGLVRSSCQRLKP